MLYRDLRVSVCIRRHTRHTHKWTPPPPTLESRPRAGALWAIRLYMFPFDYLFSSFFFSFNGM